MGDSWGWHCPLSVLVAEKPPALACTIPPHCSASRLSTLHPSALAVNLEMGGLRESGLRCAGTEAAGDLHEGSASPYVILAA